MKKTKKVKAWARVEIVKKPGLFSRLKKKLPYTAVVYDVNVVNIS